MRGFLPVPVSKEEVSSATAWPLGEVPLGRNCGFHPWEARLLGEKQESCQPSCEKEAGA